MKLSKKTFFILTTIIFISVFSNTAMAHAMGDLSELSRTDVSLIYFKLGFDHIIPLGLDHILFVLSIFFLKPKLKPVILQATVFTFAHSITLGLAMYGVIDPPVYIIEPLIALSIMFVAIENIISNELKASRIFIIFCFGLIHGMGFASALSDLGLPQEQFFTSLIMFNLGVELGQITVILCAWFLVAKWFHENTWYKQRIVIPVSSVIAFVALYWTIERTFFT